MRSSAQLLQRSLRLGVIAGSILAGVMLMNLPLLRATYYDFLDMILGRDGNMTFGGAGCFIIPR